MRINKIACGECHGKGRVIQCQLSESAKIDERYGVVGTMVKTEIECPSCKGTGYGRYPVFTVWEAIEVAKHFGFKIEGLEDENND